MSSMADIMAIVSEQLKLHLSKGRVALSHNGEKGNALEAAVRDFFREHLPPSIGVTHGQVVDSPGNLSTQLDVILYDANRTPVFFSDSESGTRLIPAEGVIAAIEVKTRLENRHLRPLVEVANTLKTLDRSSFYYPSTSAFETSYTAYGSEHRVLPPMYFIFAIEGSGLFDMAVELNVIQRSVEVSKRIDSILVLEQGVIANAHLDENEMLKEIDALPSQGSLLYPVETTHALLMFHILTSRYILQADRPPIAIQKYIPKGFIFSEG